MKINYLKIDGYKNLRTKAEFEDIAHCNNYLALIGLNGSGKSNVLEAISAIFASLFDNVGTGFSYEIRYTNKGKEVNVTNGKITVEGKEIKRGREEYLPNQVIACYSGEESRLWESMFEPFYFDFFKRVLDREPTAIPYMMYVNRYTWGIALIALMCSEAQSVKDFLKDVLKIIVDENITVDFTFDKSKYPGYKKNNDVLNLINRINPDAKEEKISISINTLRSFDIGAASNEDFVKKIFFYLYIASMPKKNAIISADKIITDISINFNGIDLKSLSEGEKKLLLIKFIMDVIGSENSLMLFDEPDAHLHVSRKKDILKYIAKANHFSVFTTHSPSLLQCLEGNNVRILNNGSEGLEVIPTEKIAAIEKLSDGAFTVMDATLAFATTKDVLLVEGTNDYKYINKAIEVLKRTKAPKYNDLDFTIINCGGAGNVAAVLQQIILPYLRDQQLCIATFDDDNAGRGGNKSIKKILDESPKNNVKYMVHPKTDVWTTNDFFLEDYFPLEAYKPKFQDNVDTASTFRALDNLPNSKGIIEKNYKDFDDHYFNDFEKLLDKLLSLQTAFHALA